MQWISTQCCIAAEWLSGHKKAILTAWEGGSRPEHGVSRRLPSVANSGFNRIRILRGRQLQESLLTRTRMTRYPICCRLGRHRLLTPAT